MVFHTGGIVFKFFRYRETSVIAKIFTARFGLQTYIINGVRSGRKGKGRMALLQPLTLLDLVAYHKENAEIQRISQYPYETIPYDVRKSTMAIFLSEVLYKCVREEGPSEELFEFLSNAMQVFDHLDEHYQNFHLQFLFRLSRFLGFGIDASSGFRMTLSREELEAVERLMAEQFGAEIILGRVMRRALLERTVEFYRQHVEGLGEINHLTCWAIFFEHS